jgi:hypothetical protein
VLLGVAFVVSSIALALWPSRVAGRERHSCIGYFIFDLFCSPLAV